MLFTENKKLRRNDRYCDSFRPISFEEKGLFEYDKGKDVL